MALATLTNTADRRVYEDDDSSSDGSGFGDFLEFCNEPSPTASSAKTLHDVSKPAPPALVVTPSKVGAAKRVSRANTEATVALSDESSSYDGSSTGGSRSEDSGFAAFLAFSKGDSPAPSPKSTGVPSKIVAPSPRSSSGPAKKAVLAEAAPVKAAAPAAVIADDSSTDGSSTDDSDFAAFLSFSKGDSFIAPPPKKIETPKRAVSAEAPSPRTSTNAALAKVVAPSEANEPAKAVPSVKKATTTYVESLSEDSAPSKAVPADAAPKAMPADVASVLIKKGSVRNTVSKFESSIASTASDTSSNPANVDDTKREVEAAIARSSAMSTEEKATIAAAAAKENATQFLHSDAPAAIEYFTIRAAEEAARDRVERRELAKENMTESARYFDKMAYEAKVRHAAEVEELISAPRPAAIEKFSSMDIARKEKQRAEIREMIENPPEMPAGQAFFTEKMQEEKAKKRAEIEELKNNPPPASAATEYFKVKEDERKVEIAKMMAEPAPAAIEFFTQKDREEKEAARLALERATGGEYEPPPATKYFAELEAKKAADIEAARSQTRAKEPMQPLPADYFSKQGEAQLAAHAEEMRKMAAEQMPIGIAYFTAKGKEDEIRQYKEHMALAEQHMSEATRHFKRLAEEKAASESAAKADIMPAAIQRFTLEERAKMEKKRAEIREMTENPPEMPAAQAVFTKKMQEEQAKKRAEIEELKNNPPPASTATEYFKVKEDERKVEIEKMMAEPAPAAIEFFTQKDREEKEAARRALERATGGEYEPPPATKYFAEQEAKKAADIEAARSQTRSKEPMQPLPADYFSKQGEAQLAAHAEEMRKIAEEQMPLGMSYFTAKGKEDEIRQYKEHMALAEQHMSVATRYFHEKALEDAAAAGADAENEIMPAAVQKFTLAAREESTRRRALNEELKNNPPPVPPGMAHFTPVPSSQ